MATGRTTICLCFISNSSVWFPSHNVLLGSICAVSAGTIFHTFRPTWPRLGYLRSTTTPNPRSRLNLITNIPNITRIIQLIIGPTLAKIDNLVHVMEKYYADIDCKLVLYSFLCVPNSCILAIFVYLFCLAYWSSRA